MEEKEAPDLFSRYIDRFPILIGFLIIPIFFWDYTAEQFNTPKWLFFYFLTAASLVAAVMRKTSLTLPKLGSERFLFLGLALSYSLSALVHFPSSVLTQLLDWICFFVVLSFSFQIFRENREEALSNIFDLNAMATVLVFAAGMLEMLEDSASSTGELFFPSSTLGFQNFTAEFVVFSILVQMVSLLYGKGRSSRLLRFFVLFLSLVYLSILHARAATLASFVAMIVILVDRARNRMFSADRIGLFALLFVILGGGAYFMSERGFAKNSTLVRAKIENRQSRLIRWKNTLKMIADHPLGIGPGNFEFGYVPYQNAVERDYSSSENQVIRSPHNGFLEIAAEGGLFSFALFMALISWMAICLFKKRGQLSNSLDSASLLLAVFVFLVIDAFFAFPLETPFLFYCAAIFLGLFFAETSSSVTLIPVHRSKWIWIGLALPVSILSSLSGVSSLLEWNFESDVDSQKVACGIFPDNWRACLNEAELRLKSNDAIGAIRVTEAILSRSPSNYFALKTKGLAQIAHGNLESGCKTLSKYDELFQNKSSLHDQLRTFCED